MKQNRLLSATEWNFNGRVIIVEAEPQEWTLLEAMERVALLCKETRLSEDFWRYADRAVDFLTEKLGLTKMQVVFLAIICELDATVSVKNMAAYLGISRMRVMSFLDDLYALLEDGWVHICETDLGNGFKVDMRVMKAIAKNEVFLPEDLNGLTLQVFVEKVVDYIDEAQKEGGCAAEEFEHWTKNIINKNLQLDICEMASHLDAQTQMVLLQLVYDYALWGNVHRDGVCSGSLLGFFYEDKLTNGLEYSMIMGENALFSLGYVEHYCSGGIADTNKFCLTAKAKRMYLRDLVFSRARNKKYDIKDPDLKSCTQIKKKLLFFNGGEKAQIEELAKLLSGEKFSEIQKRLREEDQREGFACLFYGAPGTGKTETVLQLARITGRDVMQIDISSIRDKYVGESEKNLKEVFARYRTACQNAKKVPILFFNEADAIFSRRLERVDGSVDTMNNTMQNILLQELEDLQGILIATTNLMSNLDDAFERRFLFKIEFKKPETAVKAKIWSMMLKNISEEDALTLAKGYDFSGGQIENVSRKCAIKYVLSGERPDFATVNQYCKEEALKMKRTGNPIGFWG